MAGLSVALLKFKMQRPADTAVSAPAAAETARAAVREPDRLRDKDQARAHPEPDHSQDRSSELSAIRTQSS